MVLYCPLRNEEVAHASTLDELFTIRCTEVTAVVEWVTRRNGKGLLVIFDGWDELSEQLRCNSLAAKIIRRENFVKCEVIVTSRTYASASLLKLLSIDRHVEVVGFSEYEVKEVIKGTLSKDPLQAQKLIEHLEIRGDALSLCYIPLICSIVISVCRTKEQFPMTLTELYQDFILQTIRRHVEINTDLNVQPDQIHSLDNLPPIVGKSMNELCYLAYHGLIEDDPQMTFTILQLEQLHLKEAVNKKYLGLMTTHSVYDKVSHQFIHLTIQEFLAAMWIAENNKGEEVFKKHAKEDHFKMCLRFVAGLTRLTNIHDQVFKIIHHLSSELKDDQEPKTTHDEVTETIYNHTFANMQDQHLEYDSEQCQQANYVEEGLSCMKTPAFGYKTSLDSRFHHNQSIFTDHWNLRLDLSKIVFSFQILYEAQNPLYCEEYVHFGLFKIPSLCLYCQNLSSFDMLCVSYFLENSNMALNHLHIADREQVKVFADSLTNNLQKKSTCNILQADIDLHTTQSKFLSSPL